MKQFMLWKCVGSSGMTRNRGSVALCKLETQKTVLFDSNKLFTCESENDRTLTWIRWAFVRMAYPSLYVLKYFEAV